MFTISLHGIRITALVGVFPEEKKVPNSFEVDAELTAAEEAPFMDYGELQKMASAVFESGLDTLEDCCKALLDRMHKKYPQATSGTVTIRKYTLPFGSPVRYAQVQLARTWS